MKEERIDMNQNETDNAAQSNLSVAPAVESMNQMAFQENIMQSAALAVGGVDQMAFQENVMESAAPAVGSPVGSMDQMALQENVMQSAGAGESLADVMIVNLDSPSADSEPSDLEARDPEISNPENGSCGTPALSEDADSGMMNDAE